MRHQTRQGFTLIELLVVIAIIAILAAILFPVFGSAREKARQTVCLSNLKQMGAALQMYTQDYDEGLPAWDDYWAARTQGLPYQEPHIPANTWQAKLAPYVKSSKPDDVNYPENGGLWHCPDSGVKGEQVYVEKDNGSTGIAANFTNRYSYSYGYNGMLGYSNYGHFPDLGTSYYYRWPQLAAIDQPASTVFAGDGGGYNSRIAPPYLFNCYQKRVMTPNYTYQCWEVPDRHNGGANYVFCDGHAKYFIADRIYPKPQNPLKPTAAEAKAGYAATAQYFAYSAQERQDFQNLAQ